MKKFVTSKLSHLIRGLSIIIVGSSIAWAIEGSTNIDVSNGVISLTGTVPVANGGTGVTSAGDTEVLVGDGSSFVALTIPDCDAANEALNFTDGTPNSFSCATISAGTAVYSEVILSSETAIDLNNNSIYLGANGKVSSTENNVQIPLNAGTYSNLGCTVSASPGGTILVEFGVGTCGSALTYGANLSQSLTATGAPTFDTDNQAVTSGQCVALKASTTTDVSSVHISCSVQKTSN
jgi:hypothetical protein